MKVINAAWPAAAEVDPLVNRAHSGITVDLLRQQISHFLRFQIPDPDVLFSTQNVSEERGYRRIRIQYNGEEGDPIPAFLLLPDGPGPFAAALIHHQHASQRHFGKSEVCGLVGDSLQAFGPALVTRGIAVLAPDSICFEDRRRNRAGTEPDDDDVQQHFDQMCYRILRGDTLMRKVLDDSARGISLLLTHPLIDPQRVGIMGHSYGGNTVLFHAALDERIRFACSSGAACTYRYKMAQGFGIEMAEVIPGFPAQFDIEDLVVCMAQRHTLLLSATDDGASQDADVIVDAVRKTCATLGITSYIEHQRYQGGHSLTQERFDAIVNWVCDCSISA